MAGVCAVCDREFRGPNTDLDPWSMRTPYSCNPSLPDRRGGGRGGLRVARGARRRPPAARESGTKSTPPRWGDSGSASEISRRREQSAEGGQGQTARGGVFEAGGGGGGEGHGSAPRARSLVGDAPLLRRRDGLDVAVHCASRVLVRRRLPRAAPRRQLGLREVDLWPRCGRGAAEVRPRCSRGAAEVRPRCSRSFSRNLSPSLAISRHLAP